MARKKSFYDLHAQMQRIKNSGASMQRANRASDAYTRYVGNIINSKSFRNARNRYENQIAAAPEELAEQRKRILGRKYSQSTYMGLSNG